jgi:hypothetical protein
MVKKQPNAPRSRTYAWPPRVWFLFYNGRGRFLFAENGPWVDLEDVLDGMPRTLQLGMTCGGKDWTRWTEPRLKRVEWLIKEDIEFDGDKVTIERLTAQIGKKCGSEFRWKLRVRTPM